MQKFPRNPHLCPRNPPPLSAYMGEFLTFPISPGDGHLLQSLDGHILYQGKTTSPKSNHWIISSSAVYRNSAIYIMPLYFNIDCDKAVLKMSDGVQNHSYCGAKQPPGYQLYSGNGQVKVSLESLNGGLQGQNFGFEFFTENLGMLP